MNPLGPEPDGHGAADGQHVMVLEREFPSGAKHWRCPLCERQTMLQYPGPDQRFKILVLQAGDERVVHVAAPAGVSISSARTSEMEPLPSGLLH